MTNTRLIGLFISMFVILISVFLAMTGYVPIIFCDVTPFNYTPHVVDKKHGLSYRGHYDDGVEHFQNIFYAEDTSGPNRFAPPISVNHPPGTIIDATKLGAFCPQGVGGPPLPFQSPITNISENCLSLRIARQRGTKSKAKLPVLVWIHGGT